MLGVRGGLLQASIFPESSQSEKAVTIPAKMFVDGWGRTVSGCFVVAVRRRELFDKLVLALTVRNYF